MKFHWDSQGLWILTKEWSFSYWKPSAYKPHSVRTGRRGRMGWWGAVALYRRHPRASLWRKYDTP